MDFEIRYLNGDRVPLATLDQEANNVWEIKFPDQKVFDAHNKATFAVPPQFQGQDDENEHSWYVTIGLAIVHPIVVGKEPIQPSWSTVRESLYHSCTDGDWELKYIDLNESIHKTLMYLRPYFELIDHWEAQGYRPIRTNKQ